MPSVLRHTSVVSGLLFGLMIALVTGCGSSTGPGLTPVSGTVTFNGKPAGPGTVAFVPTDGGSNAASGNIDKNGNFTMSLFNPGDGVKPGSYQVSVTIEKEAAHGDAKGNLYPTTYLSPARYMNPATSGFTVTVEKGKSLVVKYDLVP
ncbi:MAG: hypothetical protein JWN70_3408 [Planctomycetaceae bacterium]|nr:hypothetical protein [Planctomycetaceae bacterium]